MIPTFRLDLVGKKVVRIERDDEGLGIQLTGDWKIAIWAKSTVLLPAGAELPTADLDQLVGATLVAFVGDSQVERMTFDNGCMINIDLRALPGSAESMVVYGPGNMIVVWE